MKTVAPYDTPDWDAWLFAPELDMLDALCLSMNICPQQAREDYGILDAMRGDEDEGHGGPRVADIGAATTFQKRLFATRQFGRRVNLVEFVNFAHKLGWELPSHLAALATIRTVPEAIEPVPATTSGTTAAARDTERPEAEAAPGPEMYRFGPIENETRSHVSTECAAFWLNLKPQTLRAWSSKQNGPILPVNINRRLMWSVADIKRLLGKSK